MPKTNIALIGYRGTGKSTISRQLAFNLNKKKVSTDDSIITKAGMEIPQIVDQLGWEKFRDIEEEVVEDIASQTNLIIDCGGGVVERDQNIQNLKKSSHIILLTADPETIVKRIGDSTNRPALVDGKSFTEEVEEMLNKRRDKYNNAADIAINTVDKTVEELVNEIEQIIGGMDDK